MSDDYYTEENFILSELDFTVDCDNKKCNRNTLLSKKCSRAVKQKDCYFKYKKKKILELKAITTILDATFVDDEWSIMKKVIIERDNGECQLYKILNLNEKTIILTVYDEEYKMFKSILDCCHIIPRSEDKSKTYEADNIVLCSRYFHNLLDQYLHPVTRESITKEERLEWFKKARRG